MRASQRIFYDPIRRKAINIAPILPLVETREFQALRYKRQLGLTYLVFGAANHSRFEHCIGSYRGTRDLTNRWRAESVIDQSWADALNCYGAVHDVGHPAFSHVTEDFCKLDDDERTLELVRGRLRPALEQCGVDPAMVAALVAHEEPLYLAVHDKNFGTEKLDYLERDGFYTGMDRPRGLDFLRENLWFAEGRLVIDEKIVDEASGVMIFYVDMYKNVYFRKALVIAQRMFQTAVYRMIEAEELQSDELYDLADHELLGRMYLSPHPQVRDLYTRIRERRLFCEAVVIRTDRTTRETRVAGKTIGVEGVGPKTMDRLANSNAVAKSSHESLAVLETLIAAEVGIPASAVLVVPIFNMERFGAEDVTIRCSDGSLQSLRERRPMHFQKIVETAQAYRALRVCTSREYRKRLCRASKEIKNIVLHFA